MKIVRHYTNSCFDSLISGQQSVNPSREAIFILSGKYKTYAFVHPVQESIFDLFNIPKRISVSPYRLITRECKIKYF